MICLFLWISTWVGGRVGGVHSALPVSIPVAARWLPERRQLSENRCRPEALLLEKVVLLGGQVGGQNSQLAPSISTLSALFFDFHHSCDKSSCESFQTS